MWQSGIKYAAASCSAALMVYGEYNLGQATILTSEYLISGKLFLAVHGSLLSAIAASLSWEATGWLLTKIQKAGYSPLVKPNPIQT